MRHLDVFSGDCVGYLRSRYEEKSQSRRVTSSPMECKPKARDMCWPIDRTSENCNQKSSVPISLYVGVSEYGSGCIFLCSVANAAKLHSLRLSYDLGFTEP